MIRIIYFAIPCLIEFFVPLASTLVQLSTCQKCIYEKGIFLSSYLVCAFIWPEYFYSKLLSSKGKPFRGFFECKTNLSCWHYSFVLARIKESRLRCLQCVSKLIPDYRSLKSCWYVLLWNCWTIIPTLPSQTKCKKFYSSNFQSSSYVPLLLGITWILFVVWL